MASPPTANRRTKSRWASSRGSTTKSASSNDAPTACATRSTSGSKYSLACYQCSDASPPFLAEIRPHDFTKTHFIEQALNEVALAVDRDVALSLCLAVGFWRNYGRDFLLREALDERISVVGLVCDQGFWIAVFNQVLRANQIVDLPCRKH